MSKKAEIDIDKFDFKILVVDDVISNVLLLKVLLKNEKYQVVTGMNGTEALEMVEKEKPDLILLDVMMPDMDGFNVAEKLRSDEKYKDIPIIFLTALNSSTDVVKGFKSGGNDFVSKPFNRDELMARIKHQIYLIAAKQLILQKTEELRNTVTNRDKLYSVIADDLRGPIGSIKVMTNMLMNNLPDEKIGEQMFEMLSLTNYTTEEVFILLDNLLKWTKSQLGRMKVAHQDFNIMEVVHDGIDVSKPIGDLKNITISLGPEKDITVHADADMIKTIIRNLLNNAIKFSNDHSDIKIWVDEKDGFAVVNIEDKGRGIKAEDQAKLLNPETHYSTFGTNNETGSGLGLLVCKDFVKMNDGELWFTSSDGENSGSLFSFSVPKAAKA